MSDTEFALRRQTEAARDLIITIRGEGQGDDEELIADAVEGETNLLEAIGAAIDEIDECDIIEAGCKAKIADLQVRMSAADARRDRVRAAIERAMMLTDQTAMKLPTATLSLTKRKPSVMIDNEAAIPSRFFIEQPVPAPKLDKKALAEALAADPSILGAHLDNGSVSLTVRRR